MTRVVRLTLILVVFFASPMALIAGHAYDNPAAAFFGADDCEMPCWQGVQLGATPAEEALEMVNSHPWMQPSTLVGASFAMQTFTTWSWTETFPYPQQAITNNPSFHIPDGTLGIGSSLRLRVTEPVVTGLHLGTGLRLADVWLLLGSPRGFSIGRVATPRDVIMSVRLLSMGGMPEVVVNAYQTCPLTRETLWDSPVSIRMTASALVTPPRQEEYITTLIELLERYDRLYCP